MDAINPSVESVPYCLNMSSNSPVAADEENNFTIVSGTSSSGNPMCSVTLPMDLDIKSSRPDARKIPTAVINPINVGMILITVKNPLFAPLINVLYTLTF